ncbi:MAG: extracellular solute-binding protein [Chloroflexi bacterium]|nr:extracellular solute-binding protein [Chloroflexota bacterium]
MKDVKKLVLALVVIALLGCSTAQAEVVGTQAAAEATELIIWHQWAGDYYETIQYSIARYDLDRPNLQISLAPAQTNLTDLPVGNFPADRGPDVIVWANDRIGELAEAGDIVPLDDYDLDRDQLLETYSSVSVRGVTYQRQVWALPETEEGIALLVNREAIDPARFPNNPTDLTAVLALAEDYYEENGGEKALICNQGLGGVDAYHVAPIFFGFGMPEYVDEQGNTYLTSPEGLAAAEWIAALRQVSMERSSYNGCLSAFLTGEVAAWWTGPWSIAALEEANLDFTIIPMGRPFVGIKSVMLTQLALDRGHAEEALAFMQYYTSAEVQADLAQLNKTIPAAQAALENPAVQAAATVATFSAALRDGVPLSNSPYAAQQWDPIGEAVLAIWRAELTPESALEQAQAEILAAFSGDSD